MWSKKKELEYWQAHNDTFYNSNILKKYRFFDVDSYFPGNAGENVVDLAVDIGGGAFGGALPFFFKTKNRILVDALAHEFRLLGKLPSNVDSITTDFRNIPLVDECADVLFTWNVYDHAGTPEQFFKSLDEANRILKTNGLWFASFPMRKQPNENHPICIEEHWIKNWFLGHDIVDVKRIHKPHYNDNILFVTARKKKL